MSWNEIQPLRRPAGYYAFKPGAAVQVKHCASSYPLPVGLDPGDWVKILEFDAGYYSVAKPGTGRFVP
jgi:hypothetical protein